MFAVNILFFNYKWLDLENLKRCSGVAVGLQGKKVSTWEGNFCPATVAGWEKEHNTERAKQAALQQATPCCSILGGAGQERAGTGCKGALNV